MQTYWKNQGASDATLWEHEWETHGTCISTFKTDCYTDYQTGEELVQFYNTTVNLFKTLPTYTVSALCSLFLRGSWDGGLFYFILLWSMRVMVTMVMGHDSAVAAKRETAPRSQAILSREREKER